MRAFAPEGRGPNRAAKTAAPNERSEKSSPGNAAGQIVVVAQKANKE